jgi:hypothetical protein
MNDTRDEGTLNGDNNNSQSSRAVPIKTMKIGAYLQSIRLEKNLTEEDIYKNLKIKARIIKAIENQHYTSLPDSVTVSALVRQYAKFLGLDPIEMSNAYKNEMNATDHKIEVVFPDKLPSSFRPFKNSIFITLILLAIYCAWHLLNNMKDIMPHIPPVFDNTVQKDKPTKEIPVTTIQPESNPKDTSDTIKQEIIPVIDFKIIRKPEVLLQAKGADSWIEVKDSQRKRVIYSAILKNGESYKIPSDLTGLRLKAGNSSPLSITVNGEPLDILPKNNRVLRNFNVDVQYLLEYYAKQKAKPANQTRIQQ